MRYFKDLLKTRNNEIINLTRAIQVKSIFDKDEHTEIYTVKDGDTLDTIAYDYYDDINYWWVIALISGIKDIFNDLPLTSKALKSYYDYLLSLGEITASTEAWEALRLENDNKREIRLLKVEYLDEFVSLVKAGVEA